MQATERAVERLTQTHTEATDAGPVEWPPLIAWLDQSVTDVVKRGGAGSNGAGIPIDFEALKILDRIKAETILIREALHMPRKTGTLLFDIGQAWGYAKALRSGDNVPDDQWEKIGEAFEDWVAAILREQDARSRTMELTVPCPACGHRWVLDGGDRKAAIVIEFSEGRAPVAECRVEGCERMWAGWEQVSVLGVSVGASQDAAILKACGLDMDGIIARARDTV